MISFVNINSIVFVTINSNAVTPWYREIDVIIDYYFVELKREIAIWERTARLMPVVSLEERAIRDALRSKGREVREQLKEARNHTYVPLETIHMFL